MPEHTDADRRLWRRARWQRALLSGSIIWLAVKAFISMVSLVAVWLHDGPALTDADTTAPPQLGGWGFFGALHHWDSVHFLRIADGGYFSSGAESSMQAFFPGFPILARAVSEVLTLGGSTPLSLILAMWLIAALASLGATVVLFRLADATHGERVASLTVLLFLAGPYSIFLYANYSESLFVALAVAAWYCGLKDRWQLVGIFAAAATFTRINGVFLVAALVVMYAVRRHQAGEPIVARALAWFPVACAGIGGYFLYLLIRTGDPFAWQHAQATGWGRGFSWPWEAFGHTAGEVMSAATVDRRIQFALDIIFAVVIIAAVVVFLRRRQWPEATYLGLTVLAFATSFTLMSVARNSVTLFPIAILLASTIAGGQRRIFRLALLAGWLILFVFNTVMFANGFWTD